MDLAKHKQKKREWHQRNKEKQNAISREYYRNNKEKVNLRRKRWREDNKERQQTYDAKYESDNKEKRLKKNRDWVKNNPDKAAINRNEYLARKELAIPKWYEDDLVKQLYLKRNELSELWGIQLHVDHIVPLQGKNVCGLHCWDNLQLLEASLNMSKHNIYEE